MATYRKRGHTWRAEIKLFGTRDSSTFPTKAEAVAWAGEREAEIRAGRGGRIIPRTVKAALRRYSEDVSPQHRGARWEQIRLTKLEAQLPFAGLLLEHVTAADVADWRDRAMRGELAATLHTRRDGTTRITPARALASASVRREMVLLRSVFEKARREWGWLRDNPMTGIEWASAGRARSRRITAGEIAALCESLGLGEGEIATRSQRVALAFLWALETAMRAGEIIGLTWDRVNASERYVTLPKTKNGDERHVPLSRAALALLERLPREESDELAPVFGLTSASLDALFRKARDRAGIVGLRFHDSRHEAVTRLARKLDVLDLARMIGHRDLRSLQVYFNATATEIAARLD